MSFRAIVSAGVSPRMLTRMSLPALLAMLLAIALAGCDGQRTEDPPSVPDGPIEIIEDPAEATDEALESDEARQESAEESSTDEDQPDPEVSEPPSPDTLSASEDDVEEVGTGILDVLAAILGFAGRLLFILILPLGIAAALLGMPGAVLVFISTLVFAAFQGWQVPAWWVLLILLVLTLLGESSEYLLSFAGVKRSGATNTTGVWTMIGGLAGAIFGGIISPILAGIGALAGPIGSIALSIVPPVALGVIGGFLGGYLYELRRGRSTDEAITAGIGALLGRLAGSFTKALVVAVMVAIILISTWGTLF